MKYTFRRYKYNSLITGSKKSNIGSILFFGFCIILIIGIATYIILNSSRTYRIECNKKENYCFIYKSSYINKKESVKDNFMISDIAGPYIRQDHNSNSSSTSYRCGFKLKSGRNIKIRTFYKEVYCYSFINQLMLQLKSLPPNDYKYTTIYEME